MKERLKRLPFVAKIYRSLHPTYSTCGCCGLPWAVVKSHTIAMQECNEKHSGHGFFPVCEWCWQHKTQEEIDNAIIKLHRLWEIDCRALNIEVPYKLEDMLAQAYKQRKEMKDEK